MKKHFIPNDLYRKMIENVPQVSVGVIVEYQGGVLLLKRAQKPLRGKWWFPAGRVYKMEKLEKAAARKVKEETGLNAKVKRFIGFHTTQFQRFPGVKHHVFEFMYLAKGKGKVKIDNTASDWHVFKKIDPKWHKVVKKAIKDSKILS